MSRVKGHLPTSEVAYYPPSINFWPLWWYDPETDVADRP